jgi:hypothetical protein
MEEKEPKYTISYINNQPGLVIKFDHASEAENAIVAILPIFKKFKDAVINGEEKKEQEFKEGGLKATCEVHGVDMSRGISKKTNKEYWYHRNAKGEICFGKGYQE